MTHYVGPWNYYTVFFRIMQYQLVGQLVPQGVHFHFIEMPLQNSWSVIIIWFPFSVFFAVTRSLKFMTILI